MSKMIEPTGTYVLLKATKIEKTTSGGIVLPDELVEKENAVESTGVVVAIGPCAYVGWKGCDIEGKTPAECWGIKVGDLVEHKKYDAQDSVFDGFDEYRYVPDINIRGVLK